MKNLKKYISLALIATVAFSATGCNMIEKTEDAINRSTVAKVNGEKITRGEVDENLKLLFETLEEKYGENYEKNPDAQQLLLKGRQDQLQAMVLQEVSDQKAKELGINITEEEFVAKEEEYISKVKEEFETEEKFNETMESAKMTEEDLRKAGRELAVREKIFEEISKDITVNEEEVKNYFDSNQEAFTEEPNTYDVARILVETEEEANKIKERLDKGEEFATVAKEVSLDKESKENGGELGVLPYNSTKISSAVMMGAKTLEVGSISKPIQDTVGWNIVKLNEKKEYPVKKFEDVKEDIQKNLLEAKKQTNWQESFSKWIEESKIKTYDDNLK